MSRFHFRLVDDSPRSARDALVDERTFSFSEVARLISLLGLLVEDLGVMSFDDGSDAAHTAVAHSHGVFIKNFSQRIVLIKVLLDKINKLPGDVGLSPMRSMAG